jgi:uncharacterized membrane protein
MLDWIDISPWRALFVGMFLCAGVVSVLLIAASIVGKRSSIEFLPEENSK